MKQARIHGIGMSETTWQLLESDEVFGTKIRHMLSFDGWQAVAQARPKGYFAIFLMSSPTFQEYCARAIPKAIQGLNQNGISVFKTPNVKGLIHRGDPAMPGYLLAEIWAANDRIIQGIRVDSPSAARSDKIIRSILASYQFTVDEMPEREELERIVERMVPRLFNGRAGSDQE